MMYVQIYGTKRLEDALALAHMGVDHLGLELQEDEAQEARTVEIMEAVRGRVTMVLLPLFKEVEMLVAAVERLRPDVIHISSNVEDLDLDRIEAFRAAVFPTKVMKSIPVAPPEYSHAIPSLEQALAFDPYVDYLLLDTKLGDDNGDPLPGWIGITGKIHDWRISRAIVDQCRTPVILAGGLTPDNVAEAIETVRPWGVDACTGLNLYRGKKDLVKCRAFIERARATAARLAAESR
ncbi:MAG: phosphoribosylanthranilate isomerase [Ardenticatenaceae bacterium]|nr:phosphoribosylanthranilate isomerase [Ardenticatenaceae bacterium]